MEARTLCDIVPRLVDRSNETLAPTRIYVGTSLPSPKVRLDTGHIFTQHPILAAEITIQYHLVITKGTRSY